MKKIGFLLFITALLISCSTSEKKTDIYAVTDIELEQYESFGEKFDPSSIYLNEAMQKKYKDLKAGDTLDIAFVSKVNSVCKAKGCWMKLALDQEKQTMVKFKNYGFFVPKNIENDTVIVKGRAYVGEMSIEEQKHFAQDAGKNEEEIAAITKPKKTYSFIADGVLLKQ